MLRRIILIAGLSLFLAAANAGAAIINLYANLTNGQEVPPTVPSASGGGTRPASFGFATFVLDTGLPQSMTMHVVIHNIDTTGSQTPNDTNDNLTNAHIHAPAPMGMNAGVRWGFHGTPDNDTALTADIFTPFATGVGGTWDTTWDMNEGNGGTTLTLQIPNILAELAYINFHTNQFGGGEIRGQILVVPEPGTLALFGLAALGLVGPALRRRRK